MNIQVRRPKKVRQLNDDDDEDVAIVDENEDTNGVDEDEDTVAIDEDEEENEELIDYKKQLFEVEAEESGLKKILKFYNRNIFWFFRK